MSPRRRAVLLAFLATSLGLGAIVLWFPNLYDADSYFHLAVARDYAGGAIRGGLRWARLSALADGFGDKELLFHLLLAPLASMKDGARAGWAAVALLNGIAAAVVAAAAWPMLRGWSILLWPALLVGSADLSGRLLRLRPEILSLVIVVLAVSAAAQRRHRLLGALAFVYALSHTSFPLLLVLCTLWLLRDGIRDGDWSWDLVAYPLLGTFVGLLVHPQFPANVRVWLLQNVERYRIAVPDAGGEFERATLRDAVELNAAWAAGLAALWLAIRRPSSASPVPAGAERRRTAYLWIAAALSAVLFALLPRFAVYLVPLATLAVLSPIGSSEDAAPVAEPSRPLVRLAVATLSLVALGFAARNVLVIRHNLAVQGVFLRGRVDDSRQFSAKLPDGAKVAAPWSEAELYAYWAPQARYLNVLDPIFMAAWRPRAYRAQLAVFGGQEPDVPLVVGTELDSDYIAFTRRGNVSVAPRLAHDPRVRLVHAGFESLYALVPGANRAFLLDWRVSPNATLPTSAGQATAWPAYPRAGTDRARALEGLVDGRRLPGQGCRVFSSRLAVPDGTNVEYELSPQGPSRVVVDGRPVATLLGGERAVLGQGAVVTVSSGDHLFSVETCPADGFAGFYLVDRGAGDAPPIRVASAATELWHDALDFLEETRDMTLRPTPITASAIVAIALAGPALAFEDLRARGAKVEKLAGDFSFTEGPTADAAGNVFFTDQPNDRILKWSADGKLSTFLQPAGRSNGMYFDRDGNLIACADEKNELWSIAKDGKVTVIWKEYEGKKLNGPNDVWVHPSGSLYFTDPFYKRSWWLHDAPPQGGQHVYRLSADRKTLTRVTNDLEQPNGIIGTPDGKTLYVADIKAGKTYAYDIQPDGRLTGKRQHSAMGSDGMTLDVEGNLYLTGKGVHVIAKTGQEVQVFEVPEDWTANVSFGGADHRTLFITASKGLYAVRLRVKGANAAK